MPNFVKGFRDIKIYAPYITGRVTIEDLVNFMRDC